MVKVCMSHGAGGIGGGGRRRLLPHHESLFLANLALKQGKIKEALSYISKTLKIMNKPGSDGPVTREGLKEVLKEACEALSLYKIINPYDADYPHAQDPMANVLEKACEIFSPDQIIILAEKIVGKYKLDLLSEADPEEGNVITIILLSALKKAGEILRRDLTVDIFMKIVSDKDCDYGMAFQEVKEALEYSTKILLPDQTKGLFRRSIKTTNIRNDLNFLANTMKAAVKIGLDAKQIMEILSSDQIVDFFRRINKTTSAAYQVDALAAALRDHFDLRENKHNGSII
jgi:hypothetical protein